MMSLKNNILYLHNISQISGGEQSLMNLWQNLDNKRFNVFLLLPEAGDLEKRAESLGLSVDILSIPQLKLANLFKIFKAGWRLARYCREKRVHLVHSYTPRNNIISSFVGRFLGIPVIWHERNLPVENEKDMTRQFLWLPDIVICNSQAVARRFPPRKKIRVVLNGVNRDHFQVWPDNGLFKEKLGFSNKKVVGCVSNLNSRKRVEFFLEVAAGISKEYKEVIFCVVGGEFPDAGGQRLAELKALAVRLGLKDKIVFTDFQPDVRAYLYAFDVFVHGTIKEACSRAILEAMASGIPVVAVNDGGNPELIEDGKTGLLIEAQDIEGFIRGVMDVLKNDQKRSAMSSAARKRVGQFFDVGRNARETEEIYTSLLKKFN